MNFKINNRPKLPRNRFGWVDQGGNGGSGSGGSGLDSNTLNSIYDLIDWFYKVGDVVHSRYSFAGDYEVAAFRDGSSGVVNTYNASWIDSSFAWLIGYIGDSSATGDGTHIPDSSIRAWNDAADKSHTHDNKSVLDSISGQDLVNWRDTALDVSTWFYWDNETGTLHTPFDFVGDKEVAAYGNGLLGDISTYNSSWIDSSYAYLLDQIENVSGGSGGGGADIPNASALAWNEAYNKAHTHNNKAILDGISDSSISVWNEAYIDLNDWFYKEGDVIYTNYDFVGNKEVAAHGNGSLGNIDTYDTSFIDSSYRYILDLIYSIPEGGGGTIIPDPSIRAWNDAADKAHTHDNKSVLDSISNQDLTNWRDTALDVSSWFYQDENGYVHSRNTFIGDQEVAAYGNGSLGMIDTYNTSFIDSSYQYIINLIDNIPEGGGGADIPNVSVRDWNEAYNKAHTHNNKDVIDSISNTDLSHWNEAYNKAHTHNNKAILDGISDGSVSTWNSAYIDLNKWFYWNNDTSTLHTYFSFVGDQEVAAYGNGLLGDISTYNTSFIDSSFAYLLNQIENISSGSGSGADIPNVSVSDWNEAYNKAHTHDNKAILDGISNQDLTNWKDTALDVSTWFYWDNNTSTLHTKFNFVGDQEVAAYGNGSLGNIDTYNTSFIDSSYAYLLNQIENISGGSGGGAEIPNVSVSNWNEAYNKAHNHNNKDVIDSISNTDLSHWNEAYNKAHNHNNKAILDGISDSSISVWNEAYIDLNDWFYLDADTSTVYTKYNFASKKEVAAYGNGSSGMIDTYNTSWIDNSYGYLLNQIKNVSVDIDLSDYVKNSSLSANYPKNSSVANNYVKNSSLANNYVKNSSLSSNYPNNASVNNNYVKNTTFNILNTNVDNISTRLNNVSINLNDISTKLNDWFYLDADTSTVYTKYNFVSKKEVAAYGDGSLGSIDTYNTSWIDNSYGYLLNAISNIDVDVDLSEYVKNSSLSANYPKNSSISNNYVKNSSLSANYPKNSSISNNYVKNSSLSSNYPNNASVNDNYVKITSFNILNTNVDNISTRLNNVSINLNDISTKLNDWFYWDDETNTLHTQYIFVGDQEVTAHGIGESAQVDTYDTSWIDNSYGYLLNAIGNIDVDVDLSEYVKNSSLSANYPKNSSISNNYVKNSSVSNNYVKNSSLANNYPNNASVNNNYVKKTAFNSSYNELLTYMSDNYVNSATWNQDKNIQNTTITANSASIGRLNSSVSRFEQWFYIDDSSRVHCKNSFVGDEEVAAWGAGDSGGEIDLTNYVKIHADGQQTIESPIYVYDELSADDIYSFGDVRSEGDVTAVDDISAGGNLKVGGNASINGTLKVGGTTTLTGNLTLPSAVSRIQIGPTTIDGGYDSSIIFGNTNFASIRARKDPDDNRTKLVLTSGDILSFSGSYATIDCEFNHGGEDITGVGTIYCDGVDTDSDRRLKTNIKDLEFKGSLNPVEFDMVKTSLHSIGFVAQEVAEKYPQVVHENKDGYLSLDYPKITAILSAQVNYLEDKITRLEKILNEKGLI